MIAGLTFLTDTSALEALTPSPDLPTVGAATYGQLLLASQHVERHAGQPPISYAPYLFALYRSRQLSGKHSEARIGAMQTALLASPLPEVYADLLFYITDLAAFNERYAPDEEDEEDYTAEELEAAADEIDARFGVFATLDTLAGGDPAKYEQLLEIDADTILQKIRLFQLKQQVAKRLRANYAAKA